MMNPVPWLQMTNMISYQGLVRTFPNPDVWLKQPENISKLARLSGVPEGDVPGLVKGNTYLTPQQQTAELTGPVNKAIIDTAQFLKEQGKVPAVANDYSQYVTSRFVQ